MIPIELEYGARGGMLSTARDRQLPVGWSPVVHRAESHTRVPASCCDKAGHGGGGAVLCLPSAGPTCGGSTAPRLDLQKQLGPEQAPGLQTIAHISSDPTQLLLGSHEECVGLCEETLVALQSLARRQQGRSRAAKLAFLTTHIPWRKCVMKTCFPWGRRGGARVGHLLSTC